MMRDQATFYSDFKNFQAKCSVCLKNTHLVPSCPLVNYIPDRDIILRKYIHSSFQKRRNFSRNKKIRKKTNSLLNLEKIQSMAVKLNEKFEEEWFYSNESFPENDLAEEIQMVNNNKNHFTKIMENVLIMPISEKEIQLEINSETLLEFHVFLKRKIFFYFLIFQSYHTEYLNGT